MISNAPVRVTGLLATNRAFRKMGAEVPREIRQAEIDAAKLIAEEASRRAPRGTRPLPKSRRKRLHETIQPMVKGSKTYVGARARQAPHANVNHWGGTIRPRGTPIRFTPRRFILQAFAAKREEFIVLLAERLDAVFRRNGFH